MSVRVLDFAEPFFRVNYVLDEKECAVGERCIVFNLSQKKAVHINNRPLGFFQSTLCANVTIQDLERCLIIEDFDKYSDHEALFTEVKQKWVLAYDATKEERHKGVQLWRSPKIKLGNVQINMCYAGSVPLNVGLHQTHWGGPPIKEVHTQIVGFGRMQQYSEQNLNSLYREEQMAPGCSHIPMFDENCLYPWHQYETITPGIFMATEMRLTEESES